MTLHERLTAEIERREAIVSGAIDAWGPTWHSAIGGDGWEVRNAEDDGANSLVVAEGTAEEGAEHIALHDPADALRRYARDRKVLERHPPVDERPYRGLKCRHTAGSGVSWMVPWPCPEIRDVAESLGVPIEEAS